MMQQKVSSAAAAFAAARLVSIALYFVGTLLCCALPSLLVLF